MSHLDREIKRVLSVGLRQQREVILNEFKRRTPGYGGKHVTIDIPSHKHPIPGTETANRFSGFSKRKQSSMRKAMYDYTQELVKNWKFKANYSGEAGIIIDAVVNETPYVEYVEYGWYTSKGILIPGHFMATNACKSEDIKSIYLAIAKRALLVGLAEGEFNTASAGFPTQKATAVAGRENLLSLTFVPGKVSGSSPEAKELAVAYQKYIWGYLLRHGIYTKKTW